MARKDISDILYDDLMSYQEERSLLISETITALEINYQQLDIDFQSYFCVFDFDMTSNSAVTSGVTSAVTSNSDGDIQTLLSEFTLKIAALYQEQMNVLKSKVETHEKFLQNIDARHAIVVANLNSELATKTLLLDEIAQKYQTLLDKQARIAKAIADDAL